jgi:flagellar protein FliO/FliZ
VAGAARRLSVLEVLPVDARRRAVLLRCDGRDILVLTGGPQDLVLSSTERMP